MAVDAIKNLDLRRSPKPVVNSDVYGVSKKSGSRSGQMSKWLVNRLNRSSERSERETVVERSMDVVANDAHAASTIDSMGINISGTGLTPQANPYAKLLGWNREQSRYFQDQAEAAWTLWSKHADIRGRLKFWQIQYIAAYSMLMKGEFFRQPVMVDRPLVPFSFALQGIDPSRIFTPSDKRTDSKIRDGIVLGEYGEPVGYCVANTREMYSRMSLNSDKFTIIPAQNSHRPGMLHGFIQKEDEQGRGIPILSPAMKLIRDLADYLDFELIGAIITSSFPLFIETSDPGGTAMGLGSNLDGTSVTSSSDSRYQEVEPGQILYGNLNQRPHVLKTDRPGNAFDTFVERLLRAIGAAAGQPYEVIAKDFSKTNYSSARAALLEAWRVYAFYQKWLVDTLCQPCWDMVMEEAWLRGMIVLPKGSPDFYEARHLYTRAMWIPPKKGSVDPKKEMDAYIMAKEHNMMTLAQIAAELGGDWESNIEQRGIEIEMEREKGAMVAQTSIVINSEKEEKEGDDKKTSDD